MDFSFSEEQELLRAQAREFLGERFPGERIAELADSEEGWDAASWRELAELGWTGVSASEEGAARASASSRKRCSSRSSAAPSTPAPTSRRSPLRFLRSLRSFGRTSSRARRHGRWPCTASPGSFPISASSIAWRSSTKTASGPSRESRARCWQRWTRRAGSAASGSKGRRGRRCSRATKPSTSRRRSAGAHSPRLRSRRWGSGSVPSSSRSSTRRPASSSNGRSGLPGRLARAGRHVCRDGARPLARLLGRLVRVRERPAGAARRSRGQVVRGGRSRRRLRARNPGARRHRLHVGARPPPLLQARAVDRRVRRLRARAPSGGGGELLDVQAAVA